MARRKCKKCDKTHEPPTGKKCPFVNQIDEMQAAMNDDRDSEIDSLRKSVTEMRADILLLTASFGQFWFWGKRSSECEWRGSR